MKKIYLLILAGILSYQIFAQTPGELDPDFGIGGILSIPINFNNNLETISVLPDNSIITGGKFYDIDDYPVCISNKIDENGIMLPYGISGSVEYDFATGFQSESIYASVVLPNGKIILAGHHSAPAEVFIMQLFPDGSLDPSFSDDGIYTDDSFTFKTNNIDVYGNESEYKIAICGTDNGYDIPQILMLDQDGNPVSGFGSDGLYQLSANDGEFLDIVIDPSNDCFYACGYEWLSPESFISKHTLSTGDLITAFDTDGLFVFTGPSSHMRTESLLLNEAGNKVTAFGYFWNLEDDDDIFGIRLNAYTGAMDLDFGIDGFTSIFVPEQYDYIKDAVMQSDGKYYIGGHIYTESGGSDFLIGRIQSNGYADPTFGLGGFTITHIDNHDKVESIALSNDESRLYAGGRSGYGNPYYTGTIASYHTGYMVDISDQAEAHDIEFNIYPNPASNEIHIETHINGPHQFKIVSVHGSVLYEKQFNTKRTSINISSFPPGIYLLRIMSSENKIATYKIIKK